MNSAWNVVEDAEQHAELREPYSPRDVLQLLEDLPDIAGAAEEDVPEAVADVPDIHALLRRNGVSEAELRWLEHSGQELADF